MGLLRKARHLLRCGVERLAPRIRTAAKGLENGQSLFYRLRNFIFATDIFCNHTEISTNSDFGAMYFVRYVSAFNGVIWLIFDSAHLSR